MKSLIALVLPVVLLFFSCSQPKDEWKDVEKLIATTFGAANSSLLLEDAKDSTGKAIKNVALKISGLKAFPAEYPADQITSTSAMLIVQNVNPETLNELGNIHVQIEDRNIRKSYQVKNVTEAIGLLTIVTDFLEAPSNDTMKERNKCVDTSMVSDSLLDILTQQLVMAETDFGKTISHQIGGFRFGKVYATNEPVMIVWAASQKSKSTIPYTFYVSRKSGKIISFSMDQTDI